MAVFTDNRNDVLSIGRDTDTDGNEFIPSSNQYSRRRMRALIDSKSAQLAEGSNSSLIKNGIVNPETGFHDGFAQLYGPSSQPMIYTDPMFANDAQKLATDIITINRQAGLDLQTQQARQLYLKNIYEYNRFKLPFGNQALAGAISHVFFTRPNCNILDGNTGSLLNTAKGSQSISSAYVRNPELLRNLTQVNPAGDKSLNHNFNLLLSNAASSFSLKDEYIATDNSPDTLDGHKIAYGKSSNDSRSASEFEVAFRDDRNLNVYQNVKLWVDYISGVYTGEIEPSFDTIINRELDYVSSVYYIMTAEDGMTILFWSKYYGVFPKTIPSNQYSWNRDSKLTMPELNVSFQYSFKEDYIIDTIREFNTDSLALNEAGVFEYAPMYNKRRMGFGDKWVGAPYIETTKNSDGGPPIFKLRFKVSYENL